jgi:putative sporulation protein YyaC
MRFGLEYSANPEAPLKILHTEKNIVQILSLKLQSMFSQVPAHRPIIFVCVGTDRSTGDSLGPLVGTNLQKAQTRYPVFGTLEHPVHAMNLADVLNEIYRDLCDPFIVGVDACLGQLTSVGCIQIGYGPVRPGAGVNKELPPVGDIHVTGVVNVGGFMEYFVLQNTRLSLVMNMAEVIAQSFSCAIAEMNQSARMLRLD